MFVSTLAVESPLPHRSDGYKSASDARRCYRCKHGSVHFPEGEPGENHGGGEFIWSLGETVVQAWPVPGGRGPPAQAEPEEDPDEGLLPFQRYSGVRQHHSERTLAQKTEDYTFRWVHRWQTGSNLREGLKESLIIIEFCKKYWLCIVKTFFF